MSAGGRDRDGDGFVSRWSRLKREAKERPAQDEAAPEDAGEEPAAAQAAADAEAAEKTDEEVLAELELPDPETLGKGDDFSAFMSPRVPTRLRNRALRRLWGTNPVLANLDGLVDYADDYTQAATAGQVVSTVYEVGRGFQRRIAALAEAGESQEVEMTAESETKTAPDAPPADAQDNVNETETGAGAKTPEGERGPTPRKSMRFRFDDDPD